MREIKITKLNLSTKESQKTVDFIAEEKALHLFVNSIYWATILCTPKDLKEMAVGHLFSEGVLRSYGEVEEVVCEEKEERCKVTLKSGINVEDRVRLSRLHQRVITSACGERSPHQYKGKLPQVKSNLKVRSDVLFESVNQLNFKAEVFRKTGGVHVAAVYSEDGSLIAMAEDVGRHNAVDKVIGMTVIKGQDFGGCFLALSGRMSGDVAFKAAKVGIPIVASIASALSSGVDFAKKTNLTLVGFVRGKRMNIYTFPERILV